MTAFYRLFFILNIIAISNKLTAQSVKITLQRDSLVSSAGNTFTNYLTLKNTSPQAQEINLTVTGPSTLQFLSTIQENIVLSSGQIMLVPLKGLINRETSSPIIQVPIRVTNLSSNSVQSISFRIVLQEKPKAAITLYTPDDTKVLFTENEPGYLPLRLIHNRFQSEKFRLAVSSSPEGVNKAPFPLVISLLPHQDTTLSIKVFPLRHWSINTPYQIAISVTDTAGSIVGTAVYKLVVAASHKKFVSPRSFANEGYGVSAALTKLSTMTGSKKPVFGAPTH